MASRTAALIANAAHKFAESAQSHAHRWISHAVYALGNQSQRRITDRDIALWDSYTRSTDALEASRTAAIEKVNREYTTGLARAEEAYQQGRQQIELKRRSVQVLQDIEPCVKGATAKLGPRVRHAIDNVTVLPDVRVHLVRRPHASLPAVVLRGGPPSNIRFLGVACMQRIFAFVTPPSDPESRKRWATMLVHFFARWDEVYRSTAHSDGVPKFRVAPRMTRKLLGSLRIEEVRDMCRWFGLPTTSQGVRLCASTLRSHVKRAGILGTCSDPQQQRQYDRTTANAFQASGQRRVLDICARSCAEGLFGKDDARESAQRFIATTAGRQAATRGLFWVALVACGEFKPVDGAPRFENGKAQITKAYGLCDTSPEIRGAVVSIQCKYAGDVTVGVVGKDSSDPFAGGVRLVGEGRAVITLDRNAGTLTSAQHTSAVTQPHRRLVWCVQFWGAGTAELIPH